jgi:hypothetical protein
MNMVISQNCWEEIKSTVCRIWKDHIQIILIGSIILGFLLVVFSTTIDTISFAIGTVLMFVGIFWIIYKNSTENFWGSTAFLLIVMGVFIGYLMTLFTIQPDKIQGLLTVYITIDTAIVAVVFAATAIKPENFFPIKKIIRDFLLITSFWVLLSILIYCLSFFDLFNTSIGFKVLLAGSTVIQIVIIFNFMRVSDEMFNRVVQPSSTVSSNGPQSLTPQLVSVPVTPNLNQPSPVPKTEIHGTTILEYEGLFVFLFGFFAMVIEFIYYYTTPPLLMTWISLFVHAVEATSPGITLAALGLAIFLGAKTLKESR